VTFSLFDLAFVGSLTGAAVYDADAQAYITAVEAADGQALEVGVKDAINAFVVGCKADGIWNAIKASCILAGARTLAGALVPLVGPAPTNFNFVAGDYNRKTGLVGDGNTKNLDSNRLCSSDEQNNVHGAVYVSTRDTAAGRYLSGTTFPAVPATGTFAIVGNTTGFRARVQASVLNSHSSNTAVPVLLGVSRASSASYSWRDGSNSGTQSTASTGVSTGNYFIFSDNTGGNDSNARLTFYSIGESLDLALLDARVTTLVNAFAAAIP
jgi:hypothetical protein